MMLVVVSCIAAVYAFRWYLVYGTDGDWGKTWGGVIASVVNSVQIQILNAVYRKVAVALTGESNGIENHNHGRSFMRERRGREGGGSGEKALFLG